MSFPGVAQVHEIILHFINIFLAEQLSNCTNVRKCIPLQDQGIPFFKNVTLVRCCSTEVDMIDHVKRISIYHQR